MDINFRKATVDDVDLLIKLRFDFLLEADGLDEIPDNAKETLPLRLANYFVRHFADGMFMGIIAENVDNREAASTAWMVCSEIPCNFNNVTGKKGYIVNVFTYPQYRRMGMATKTIGYLLSDARSMGIEKVDLIATETGKLVYEKIGFTADETYMKMKL